MSKPADLDVCAASAALANMTISARVLALSCLARIGGTRGQALNAFIHVAENSTLAQAEASDRRRAAGRPLSTLDGVPIAIKDNIDVLGMPTTNGLGISWIADADAPVVRRLREMGMTILGKLNMHEAALGATNDNPHHGRCMHPAFPGFTPGGSSGGSAAAVAGGLCPAALGTDTMGSVRLPAAYCGIVGFKPSQTYWPVSGVMALAFGLDTIGPLARSVADIALLLGEPLDEPVAGDLRFARLGNADDVATEPECRAAFDAALSQMTARGIVAGIARVPHYDPALARRAGFIVSEVDAAAVHAQLMATAPHAFSASFLAMLRYGEGVTPERYQAERRRIEQTAVRFLELFERADIVITLTAPQRAFAFTDPVPRNQADLTAIANFAGCPAISLPLPVPPGERPVGMQLIAAPGQDRLLLRVGALVETIFISE